MVIVRSFGVLSELHSVLSRSHCFGSEGSFSFQLLASAADEWLLYSQLVRGDGSKSVES